MTMLESLAAAGFDARMIRGKPCLADCFVDAIVSGYPVSFTRRRYGSTTFTWAMFFHNGQWVSLGDPWQGTKWPVANLAECIRKAIPPRCAYCQDTLIHPDDPTGQADCGYCGGSFRKP